MEADSSSLYQLQFASEGLRLPPKHLRMKRKKPKMVLSSITAQTSAPSQMEGSQSKSKRRKKADATSAAPESSDAPKSALPQESVIRAVPKDQALEQAFPETGSDDCHMGGLQDSKTSGAGQQEHLSPACPTGSANERGQNGATAPKDLPTQQRPPGPGSQKTKASEPVLPWMRHSIELQPGSEVPLDAVPAMQLQLREALAKSESSSPNVPSTLQLTMK